MDRCRVSGSQGLVSILNLGHQALTGVFPNSPDEEVAVGTLELVWSPSSGLSQSHHSCKADEMSGETPMRLIDGLSATQFSAIAEIDQEKFGRSLPVPIFRTFRSHMPQRRIRTTCQFSLNSPKIASCVAKKKVWPVAGCP
ncbi:hypothetical protein [Roseibium aggregatum]|nr:hypothetical protein [Roseibium aggregatum]